MSLSETGVSSQDELQNRTEEFGFLWAAAKVRVFALILLHNPETI